MRLPGSEENKIACESLIKSGKAVSPGVRVAIFVFLITTVLPTRVAAQIPDPPLPIDPTPLPQLLQHDEKALLSEANNPKKLIEAYLKISDNHLLTAAGLVRAENFVAAERELDIYNKAVAAAGKEAFSVQENKRSLSKRIEQALYKQIKILETIERQFPSEREMFADAALKHTKQMRVQALNEAFDSGGVLRDPNEEKKPKTSPPQENDFLQNSAMRNPRTLVLPAGFARAKRDSLLGEVSVTALRVSPQTSRDYMTEEEDEKVREAQIADARAKVFMKIADRRLKAIVGIPQATTEKKDPKKAESEEKEWGTLPQLSRADLLRHYSRAISESMAKLEDAYERNPKSSALPKALSILRDATDKHLELLRGLKSDMKDETERSALIGAIEEAEIANRGARDGLSKPASSKK